MSVLLLSGYDTVPSSSVARSEFPVFDAEYKHQLAEANSSLLWNKKRDQFTARVEQRASARARSSAVERSWRAVPVVGQQAVRLNLR